MRILSISVVLILTLFATGCSLLPQRTEPSQPARDNASVSYCESRGGIYQERARSGGRVGYCVFPDATECEAWAFFHSLCTRETSLPTSEPTVPPAPVEPTTPATPTPSPSTSQTQPTSSATPDSPVSSPAQPLPSGVIVLESPTSDKQLSSPVEISGSSTLPDGSMLTVAFQGLTGNTIFTVPISVRGGAFKGSIRYEFSSTKSGYISVYQLIDGTKQHEVRVPVRY